MRSLSEGDQVPPNLRGPLPRRGLGEPLYGAVRLVIIFGCLKEGLGYPLSSSKRGSASETREAD